MTKAESGTVWRYFFLWSHQSKRGEETGRKARPVCLQLLLNLPPEQGDNPVLLIPLTTKRPTDDIASLQVPPLELRRVGLEGPSWLVFDDLNLDRDFAQTVNLAEPHPLGRFSPAFTRIVKNALQNAVRHRRSKVVSRKQE